MIPMMSRIAQVAVGLALLAAPAAAQTYGQPYQPGFQPQPGYQAQPGYQPSPGNQPQPGSSPLVGTWSGTATGTSGQVQAAEAYSADGTFVSAGRLPNGFIVRFWGAYRLSSAGPNQFRLESQLQGWLPREICRQLAGSQPQCQPFQLPTTTVSIVSFPSPNQFQSASQTEAGSYSVMQRDSQPVLLQVQAPQRWTNVVQPAPGPAPGPAGGGYVPHYSPGPVRPYMNGCPGDDGARARCKYTGRLVPSGGCLQCVD